MEMCSSRSKLFFLLMALYQRLQEFCAGRCSVNGLIVASVATTPQNTIIQVAENKTTSLPYRLNGVCRNELYERGCDNETTFFPIHKEQETPHQGFRQTALFLESYPTLYLAVWDPTQFGTDSK
jgi:hypothetical protein